MKRRLFKLGLFLLLGAIVNIALALALLQHDPGKFENEAMGYGGIQFTNIPDIAMRSLDSDSWPASREHVKKTVAQLAHDLYSPAYINDPQGFECEIYECPGLGRNVIVLNASYIIDDDHEVLELGVWTRLYFTGWPVTFITEKFNKQAPNLSDNEWTRDLWHIAWSHFFSGTTIWACALAFMFYSWSLGKRTLRKLRGCCPQCAYDLRRGSSIRCPKCGWRREAESQDEAIKRLLFKLTTFLLLGAIVNLAVAWGCAVKLDTRRLSSTRIMIYQYLYPDNPPNTRLLRITRWSKPGAIRFLVRCNYAYALTHGGIKGQPESLVPNWISDHLLSWKNDSSFNWDEIIVNTDLRLQADARGWPMYSVWCVWGEEGEYIDCYTKGGIRLPDKWTSQHDRQALRPTALPYRPIWPGFAINTIFYASLVWSITLGPFTMRRFIRRKRGHCLKCGYDLRGSTSPGCPECGWGRIDEEIDSTQQSA